MRANPLPLLRRLLAAQALAVVSADPKIGATLDVRVLGVDDAPVEHAVVVLHAADSAAAAPAAKTPGTAIMDQREKQFMPHVLAVRAGTLVEFPNSDQVRHHVYSFSEANRFELKLYSGVQAKPVLFDRDGVVVLGCNIHDAMLGYIFVAPTPYFAVTTPDGTASIEAPPGAYRLELWHPRTVPGKESSPRPVQLRPDEPTKLELRTEVTPHHSEEHEELSPLEQRFRKSRTP